MTMPNFLIIGVQKSGTTSLHNYLNQHPQVYMSPVKEPHFFLGEKLQKWQYYPGQRLRIWHNRVTTIEAYRNLFKGVTNQKAIGESSVWYLYTGAAIQIKKQIPRVKLIAVLRNPVDRCFSDFKQGLTLGYETMTDFSRALGRDQDHLRNNTGMTFHYVPQGFYAKQIKNYLDIFDRTQIKFYLYEDMRLNTEAMLRDIFRFLEVDDAFRPNLDNKENVSPLSYDVLIPRHNVLRSVFGNVGQVILASNGQFSQTEKSLRQHFWEYKQSVKYNLRLSVQRRSREISARLLTKARLMTSTTVTPVVNGELRKQLVDLYRADIIQSADLIQRDLSEWHGY